MRFFSTQTAPSARVATVLLGISLWASSSAAQDRTTESGEASISGAHLFYPSASTGYVHCDFRRFVYEPMMRVCVFFLSMAHQIDVCRNAFSFAVDFANFKLASTDALFLTSYLPIFRPQSGMHKLLLCTHRISAELVPHYLATCHPSC